MGIQVGYPEGFPGLEDEEPLKLAEKSFFGNAVPTTRLRLVTCCLSLTCCLSVQTKHKHPPVIGQYRVTQNSLCRPLCDLITRSCVFRQNHAAGYGEILFGWRWTILV